MDAEKMVEAVGSLAEIIYFFYERLCANGFDKNHALELCEVYLTALVESNKA